MQATDGRPRTRAELDRRIEREFGFEQGYASAASVMVAVTTYRLRAPRYRLWATIRKGRPLRVTRVPRGRHARAGAGR